LYIFLSIIIFLIFNANAYNIPEYHYKRKIKRDDTLIPTPGAATELPVDNSQPTDNNVPKPTIPSSEPEKEKEKEKEKEPEQVVAPTPSSNVPVITSQPQETQKNDTEKKESEATKKQDNIATATSKNSSTKTSSSSSTNDNKNDSKTSNESNKKKDSNGLSGGIIGLIVVGGIFALGVVILIFRSLLKVFKTCTKGKKDYPTPVLNVVSNQGTSSEQLNPQNGMSQNPMIESGYYNQSTSTIPASPYYPQQQQPVYDNGGVDISKQYQQNDYQNGYVDGGMVDDYPVATQPDVIQPIRNFSSLRRQPPSGNRPQEMPLEGYDNSTMMNGEITDVNQPHKVIINKSNNIPIEPGTIHKAQFPFVPNMDDELKLNAGDAIEIIEVYDDGWSYGKNMINNEVGVFPISYITGYNDPTNNF